MLHILLVEDSVPTRDLIRRSLQDQGMLVHGFAGGEAALKAFPGGRFDVVVIDVGLPGIDGFEVCRRIRSHDPEVPILFLTARGTVGDRIAGLDLGADDYMQKPFALAELRARIRAMVRRRGAHRRLALSKGPFNLNFRLRTVLRDGQEVPLTAREWKVLEALASRPGEVVPRTELLEFAWGEASPGASESLDVIMSRLRKKLDDGSGWIRTIRGEGFLLDTGR